jgi:capsular polysaccharide biosynthesis protein
VELKRYLQIIIAKRWIVLSTCAVTLLAVVLLTLSQTPTYESSTKYVVRPVLTDEDAKSLWTALDILSRSQIQTTLAEVANSRVIKNQAGTSVGLSGQQLRDLAVSARPLAGTNVLQITAEGPDPLLAKALVSAVGSETATYLKHLYGTFELQVLDEPTTPASPSHPKTTFNLLFGTVAGLVLGVSLAFLSAYLGAPARVRVPTSRLAQPGQRGVPAPIGPAGQRQGRKPRGPVVLRAIPQPAPQPQRQVSARNVRPERQDVAKPLPANGSSVSSNEELLRKFGRRPLQKHKGEGLIGV